MKNQMRIGIVLSIMLCLANMSHAEETSITLPTADTTSSFDVYNSGSTNLFKVRGDAKVGIRQSSPRAELEIGGTDGLLCTGTPNSGTVRALGEGVRMHWYPRKGAFRVGMAEGDWWDDDGGSNPNLALYSIGMGFQPRASGVASVAIGAYNKSTESYALTLGSNCEASESYAIAIGNYSIASGIFSMALGNKADTNGKDGAVVIGDDSPFADTYATSDNQITMRFSAQPSGQGDGKAYRFFTTAITDEGSSDKRGVYMNRSESGWTNYSSRELKENFRPLDGEMVLAKIRDMSVTEWNYKGTPELKYIGTVAEEFWDAFHLNGTDNKGLNSISMDGVNMAGVQALERRTSDMKAVVADMRAEIDRLRAEIAGLKARLAAR